MKNTFGNNITLTIFGESHGSSVGCVLDGIPAGIPVDYDSIKKLLDLRRPSGAISTARSEEDAFEIHSGVFNGCTTGTPICIIIPNKDTRSADYENISHIARPSHADYTAHIKYRGYEDPRGGGHFSGRITAALVAAGAICKFALEQRGIYIGTHVKKCAGIADRDFDNLLNDINSLNKKTFAVLTDDCEKQMTNAILDAASEGDSVGGILETAIVGMPAGVGEPWFDSVESQLAHMMFSIPAVKGIEFGAGFAISDLRGSTANDPMRTDNGKVITTTNNNGGINGGITNGMPIVFRTAIKPTPTIFKPQDTIDFRNMTETVLESKGRHDPAIVHRARIVIDAVTAIAIYDMLAGRFGTDYFAKED
jgi:chorismate synthase